MALAWPGLNGWSGSRWRWPWLRANPFARDAWVHGLLVSPATEGSDALREQPGARLERSDDERFEAFFQQQSRELFGYLWRLTGEEQAAHDLCQETFLRAWQSFARVLSSHANI